MVYGGQGRVSSTSPGLSWKLKKLNMKLKIEATVIESRRIEASLAIPSFWKDPCKSYDSYRAVIDENTFIEFHRFWDGDIVSIENSTVERRKEKIIEANEKWDPVIEQEFMTHYDDAFECMRLHAKLAV